MQARPRAVLGTLVALVVLSAPASAQDQQPERSKAVEKVYRDYRDDGVIEACDHSKKTLKKTLEQLQPEADVDTPDLRPALEAAIEQHEDGDCDKPQPTATPEPTATPQATATPAPTATAAPTAAPAPTDDSRGSLVPPPGGGGGSGKPPGAKDVKPLNPQVTPVPPAATPAPTAPAPAEPSGPAATPAPVYSNGDDGVPISLIALAGLLGLVALLALLFAALGRLGWADSRLARPRRALREAGFRAGGAWGDFADWIRFGR